MRSARGLSEVAAFEFLLQLDSGRAPKSARSFVFFRRHFPLAHKHSSLSLQTMADPNECAGSFE